MQAQMTGEPDILIPEIKITESMIHAYGDGTQEPLRDIHYAEGIAFGLQLEGIIDKKLGEVTDIGRYAGQHTFFKRAVRAGDSVRIAAWKQGNGGTERRFTVVVWKNDGDKECLESTVRYAPQFDSPEEQQRGDEYSLMEDDLRKVQEGIAAPQDGVSYPLALGLASKPLVELAKKEGGLAERLKKEAPVYVQHRIEVYGPAHDLHPNDQITVSPKVNAQKQREVSAEVLCFNGGRKVYKIEMDLMFVPRKLLRRI